MENWPYNWEFSEFIVILSKVHLIIDIDWHPTSLLILIISEKDSDLISVDAIQIKSLSGVNEVKMSFDVPIFDECFFDEFTKKEELSFKENARKL